MAFSHSRIYPVSTMCRCIDEKDLLNAGSAVLNTRFNGCFTAFLAFVSLWLASLAPLGAADRFPTRIVPPKLSSSTSSVPQNPNLATLAPGSTASVPLPTQEKIQELVQKVRSSVVVVSHHDRKGQADGVGAGVVIPGKGLVATSLHVIGEGRPISIQTDAGDSLEVVEIVAWDRHYDLAILRVEGKVPKALELGEIDSIKQGQDVMVIGNPLGFEHSVVRGVVSAFREIEEVSMIQMAVPIEPGNSGGPVVDMSGKVQGIVTLKSATAANVGFAVPVAALRKLLDHPSPVSRDVWLNLGVLDPAVWKNQFGARWRQRVDRIVVEGVGEGFGGRTLCLREELPGDGAYELRASVKLGDEAGAAGLVFGSDGMFRHYGFYPSGGQLRLTRFDGPDVFSWSILRQDSSPHYRSGDWNDLRVRVESGRIRCWVNGEVHAELEVEGLVMGRVGLCQFRGTSAEFRHFEMGRQLGGWDQGLTVEEKRQVDALLAGGASLSESAARVTELGKRGRVAQQYLSQRVQELERQAESLRQLSRRVHAMQVHTQMAELFRLEDSKVDLMKASLLVSLLDEPELDIQAYQRQVEQLADRFNRGRTNQALDAEGRLEEFKKFFFKEQGFHGSRQDYYDRANSYLNQVIEHREGIPITLSVLFMEVGRRAGVVGLEGHPLPGHFMVRRRGTAEGAVRRDRVMDIFRGGEELTHAEADAKVEHHVEDGVRSELMEAATKREIVVRMIRNLLSIARNGGESEDVGRYLDLLLVVDPEAAMERVERARFRARGGDREGSREDVRWLLDHGPPGMNRERLEEFLEGRP